MAYLEGVNLVAAYGVVPILHECSVEVEKGELAIDRVQMTYAKYNSLLRKRARLPSS